MARRSSAGRALLAVLVATAALAGGAAASTAGTTQECSYPFSTVDATGTEVTIDEEPQRVVTTNPSAAQTMWEIGASEKVVGVSQYAMYLEGADQKANVSGPSGPSVERVLARNPDLVLVPNATFDPELVEKLRDTGLTVFHFEAATSLEDVSEKTVLTGRLVGSCAAAQESADRMDAEVRTVREAVEGEERPRVLYVLGPSGYVAGAGTFIHTAIEAAGAENIAAERNLTFYQPISPEVVAEEDPDWIVKPRGVSLPDSDAYNQTTAVQEGRVLEVDRNFINQPAPQIVRPIRTMARTFHPEAYAEANTTTPTATSTPGSDGAETSTPTPTPATGPGFGVGAALLALLGTLVLARRR